MLRLFLKAASFGRANTSTHYFSQAMKFLVAVFTVSTIGGCAMGTTAVRYEEDTKTVVELMAFDLPLPESSDLDLGGTVVAGTGENWSGRIALVDDQTRGSLLRFFAENGVDAGWTIRSTTISDRMTLVLEKEERVASIEIGGSGYDETAGFFGAGTRDGRTRVSITVNHKGAVNVQRPFSSSFSVPSITPSAKTPPTSTSPLDSAPASDSTVEPVSRVLADTGEF